MDLQSTVRWMMNTLQVDFGPDSVETDGEAANPGPGRSDVWGDTRSHPVCSLQCRICEKRQEGGYKTPVLDASYVCLECNRPLCVLHQLTRRVNSEQEISFGWRMSFCYGGKFTDEGPYLCCRKTRMKPPGKRDRSESKPDDDDDEPDEDDGDDQDDSKDEISETDPKIALRAKAQPSSSSSSRPGPTRVIRPTTRQSDE